MSAYLQQSSAAESDFLKMIQPQKMVEPKVAPASKPAGVGSSVPAPSTFDTSFGDLQTGFRNQYGRDFEITGGANTPMHQKLHGGLGRDIRVKDLTPEQGDWVIENAKQKGFDVRDFRTNWKAYGASGPHIHIDVGGHSDAEQAFRQLINADDEPAPQSKAPVSDAEADFQRLLSGEGVSPTQEKTAQADESLPNADWNPLRKPDDKNAKAMVNQLLTNQHVEKSGLNQMTAADDEADLSKLSNPHVFPDARGLTIGGYSYSDPYGGKVIQSGDTTIAQDPRQFLAPTQKPVTQQAQPDLPDTKRIKLLGVNAKNLTPELLRRKVMEHIGFTPEDGEKEPWVFGIPADQMAQYINPDGSINVDIPQGEYDLLERHAKEAQLKRESATPLDVQNLTIGGYSYADPMGGKVLQGGDKMITQDPHQFLSPAPVATADNGGGLLRADTLQQGINERNANRKPDENIFVGAGRDIAALTPGLMDIASRPFQYLSTLVSGVQRRVGAGLGSPFSEDSAKTLEEYGLGDILDAAAERFYTGKVRPGYEQPVAELTKLAVEKFGGNPNEALPKLLINTLEAGTDPVNYLGMEAGAGKAPTPHAPGSFRAALDDIASKVRPTESIPETVKPAAAVEKAPKDYTFFDRFRSRLSNLDAPGVYERKGGAVGRELSENLRDSQIALEMGGRDKELILRSLRKDVEGAAKHFEANGQPGLAEAARRHINRIEAKPSAFEKEIGNAIKAAPGLRDVVKNPDTAFRDVLGTIRSVNYALRVKWNAKSIAVNELQPLITLWPEAKTADFARAMVTARRPSFRARMKQLGVFDTGAKVEGVGESTAEGLKGWVKNPFAKASETNRAVGYALGEIEGKRLGLTGDDLHRRAMDWAKKTEFDNSAWDVPDILSSPMGQTIGQYKGFAMKNLENVGRTLKYRATDTPVSWSKRVAKFGTAVGLQGGIKATGATAALGAVGIPIYKVIQGLTGAITRTGVERDDAEKMAQVMVFGTPAMAGFDVSASVALLDEPFGDTMIEKAINTLGGTNIASGVALGKAGMKYRDGDKQGAIDDVKKLTPYLKTYDMADQMIRNDGRGATVKAGNRSIELTPGEAVGRGLGFTPLRQTLGFQDMQEAKDDKAELRDNRLKARRDSVVASDRFKQAPEGYDLNTYQKTVLDEADHLAKLDAKGNREASKGDEDLIFHNANVQLEHNKFSDWVRQQNFYKGLNDEDRKAFDKATLEEFAHAKIQPRKGNSIDDTLEDGRERLDKLIDDADIDRIEFIDRIIKKAKVGR